MQSYDPSRPWVVYRRLPNCQNLTVARFQRRTDAEQYLTTVQNLIPQSPFMMAFDNTNPVQQPHRHRLRHYLVGSPIDTQQAIDRLHILGYTERIVWSQPVQIPDDGLIIRPDPGNVLRYTQWERTLH